MHATWLRLELFMHAASPALYTQQRPRGTHGGVVRAVRAGRRTHRATLPHHLAAISPPLLHVTAPQHARMHTYSTCMYVFMCACHHSLAQRLASMPLLLVRDPGSRVQGRPCHRGRAQSSAVQSNARGSFALLAALIAAEATARRGWHRERGCAADVFDRPLESATVVEARA